LPQLAQLNVARMKFAPDDPAMADFMAALDPVNASAEASPGFVWRMVSGVDDPPDQQAFEASGWLLNITVWQSLDDLLNFVRSADHLAIMRRRSEWFEAVEVNLCLWWVADGHHPTFAECMERLEHLRVHGPTLQAFNFRSPFEAPDG
jgi:hypothetical protein